ncbi:hypothetical protein G6F37_011926 [Rhizopus arrhizus]|nr:hypothetical protein G6F38_009900 [Rhizopus arrhizus]KAG1146657.1 hypothetical protein G6F37_011926 [Rhizopus arrhizus]
MSLSTVIAFALLLKKITRKTSKKNLKSKRKTSSCPETSLNEEQIDNTSRRLEETSSIPQLKATLQSSLEDIISPSIKEDLDVANNTIELNQLTSPSSLSSSAGSDVVVTVRDFAYPKDSPLHFGNPLPHNQSTISLSSPDFTGRDARALFDFVPETEYEIELKAGQLIWVQYRQCPGWLIADVEDQTGLVPESYVEFV